MGVADEALVSLHHTGQCMASIGLSRNNNTEAFDADDVDGLGKDDMYNINPRIQETSLPAKGVMGTLPCRVPRVWGRGRP